MWTWPRDGGEDVSFVSLQSCDDAGFLTGRVALPTIVGHAWSVEPFCTQVHQWKAQQLIIVSSHLGNDARDIGPERMQIIHNQGSLIEC